MIIYILWLIDIIIISKGFWYKDILGSHKGKTRSVIRRCLVRYHLLVRTVFKLFYSYQSHDWPGVYFVVFPKLLGAQFCTGSQVVRNLQILEELEQEASGSYSYSLFPLCCKCYTLIMMYIQVQMYISSYVIYIICYSFRCEVRVTLMLCSSSSYILSFYLIFPHPLSSFY